MYKLLAMDLDGTLIGNDLLISERVKRAVAAAEAAGVWAALATGRMFRATLPFARTLGITTPAICYQGAMVHNIEGDGIIYEQPVPLAAAREAVAEAQARGFVTLAYVDDWCYAGKDSPEAQFYARHSRIQPRFVGELLDWLETPPTKLVIVSTAEQTDANVAQFRQIFGSRLNVTKSYPLFTEIIHPDVSKGRALARLAERLGVAREEVVAIGDNLNDLDMIEYAGLGIAMGNGAPAVRQAAGWTCPTQAEDGVAVAIEERILAEAPRAAAARP
ncbi:MAG TPA: Cof-type HAD-IIB family hydrolase [Chloroflexota bacterium]|nr:Cof-type HAD-IIB family hydrolase [Chloroflexota bacterium]